MRKLLLISALFLGGCAAPYKVVCLPINKIDYAGVKLNTSTGESWWLNGNSWGKFQESAPIPRSRYDLSLVALRDDFGGVRYDTKTGRAWIADKGRWVEVTEQPSVK